MAETLRVTEIFRSIQGEGTRAGRPCTFVRLTGCGLRCAWCDTAYAFTGGEDRPLEAVLAQVAESGTDLVCVTGGEPLEQPAALALIARLCDAGAEVVVETGGHVDIAAVDPRAVRIVDLKCPGSRMAKQNRWENLPHLRARDEVKLVIADRADYEWARDRIAEHALAQRVGAVLLSPVHGALPPEQLAEWMLADRVAARLQIQLHRYLWPEVERGV